MTSHPAPPVEALAVDEDGDAERLSMESDDGDLFAPPPHPSSPTVNTDDEFDIVNDEEEADDEDFAYVDDGIMFADEDDPMRFGEADDASSTSSYVMASRGSEAQPTPSQVGGGSVQSFVSSDSNWSYPRSPASVTDELDNTTSRLRHMELYDRLIAAQLARSGSPSHRSETADSELTEMIDLLPPTPSTVFRSGRTSPSFPVPSSSDDAMDDGARTPRRYEDLPGEQRDELAAFLHSWKEELGVLPRSEIDLEQLIDDEDAANIENLLKAGFTLEEIQKHQSARWQEVVRWQEPPRFTGRREAVEAPLPWARPPTPEEQGHFTSLYDPTRFYRSEGGIISGFNDTDDDASGVGTIFDRRTNVSLAAQEFKAGSTWQARAWEFEREEARSLPEGGMWQQTDADDAWSSTVDDDAQTPSSSSDKGKGRAEPQDPSTSTLWRHGPCLMMVPPTAAEIKAASEMTHALPTQCPLPLWAFAPDAPHPIASFDFAVPGHQPAQASSSNPPEKTLSSLGQRAATTAIYLTQHRMALEIDQIVQILNDPKVPAQPDIGTSFEQCKGPRISRSANRLMSMLHGAAKATDCFSGRFVFNASADDVDFKWRLLKAALQESNGDLRRMTSFHTLKVALADPAGSETAASSNAKFVITAHLSDVFSMQAIDGVKEVLRDVVKVPADELIPDLYDLLGVDKDRTLKLGTGSAFPQELPILRSTVLPTELPASVPQEGK